MIGNRIDDLFRDYAVEKYGENILEIITEEMIVDARIYAFTSFGELAKMYIAAGLNADNLVEEGYSIKGFYFQFLEANCIA
jgi:hypothetical protein